MRGGQRHPAALPLLLHSNDAECTVNKYGRGSCACCCQSAFNFAWCLDLLMKQNKANVGLFYAQSQNKENKEAHDIFGNRMIICNLLICCMWGKKCNTLA